MPCVLGLYKEVSDVEPVFIDINTSSKMIILLSQHLFTKAEQYKSLKERICCRTVVLSCISVGWMDHSHTVMQVIFSCEGMLRRINLFLMCEEQLTIKCRHFSPFFDVCDPFSFISSWDVHPSHFCTPQQFSSKIFRHHNTLSGAASSLITCTNKPIKIIYSKPN